MGQLTSQTPIIELRAVDKSYGNNAIIQDFNLTINNGEFVTLLGPSGCGKTTILRLLAGLEVTTGGKIILDGQDITDMPAEKRYINTVFQSYALFPHMSIFENVAFGLRLQKVAKDEIEQRVHDALKMVQLENMAQRRPDQLSGGQQQRVAMARAVILKPKVLLLDESLSALDYKLRRKMQNELKALQRKLGITFIFVTHDQEEALTMSDRIIVMQDGKIVQDGSPREIYETPKNLYVAKFIGEINIFDATVVARINPTTVQVNISHYICLIHYAQDVVEGMNLKVLLRPEDLLIKEINDEISIVGRITGRIKELNYKGMTLESSIELSSGQMILVSEFFNEDDPHVDHSLGQRVAITWIERWEVVLNETEENEA